MGQTPLISDRIFFDCQELKGAAPFKFPSRLITLHSLNCSNYCVSMSYTEERGQVLHCNILHAPLNITPPLQKLYWWGNVWLQDLTPLLSPRVWSKRNSERANIWRIVWCTNSPATLWNRSPISLIAYWNSDKRKLFMTSPCWSITKTAFMSST